MRLRVSAGIFFQTFSRLKKKYQLINATTGMALIMRRYGILSTLYGFWIFRSRNPAASVVWEMDNRISGRIVCSGDSGSVDIGQW